MNSHLPKANSARPSAGACFRGCGGMGGYYAPAMGARPRYVRTLLASMGIADQTMGGPANEKSDDHA